MLALAVALLAAIEASLGITLNLLDGSHAINGGAVSRVTFVPIPLGELRLRRGADALVVEGLPPVAFAYTGDKGIGRTATRLSILEGVYRRLLPGGWWVGAGATLYNQHTTYAEQPNTIYTRYLPGTELPGAVYPIAGAEEQWSRVGGVRYEAGRSWRRGSTRFEAVLGVDPAMHGVQYTFIPTGTGRNPTFADPETASQLDLRLDAVRPAGPRDELVLGLRYLHFSGRYVDHPGQLADRNVGIAPLVGYRVRL